MSRRNQQRRLKSQIESDFKEIENINLKQFKSQISNISQEFQLDSEFEISEVLSSAPTNNLIEHESSDSVSEFYQTSSESESSEVRHQGNVNIQDAKTFKFQDELQNWAVSENITHTAVDKLLQILNRHGQSVPQCAKTLLSTPRISQIEQMGNGRYWHYGFKKALEQRLCSGTENSVANNLTLLFNIDGLPVYKNSCVSIWPVLVIIKESNDKQPIPICAYEGDGKPKDLNQFLDNFIQEALLIFSEGCIVNNISYSFDKNKCMFICDAPARAFVKGIKGHNGYYGCDRCHTKGKWMGKMTFPELECSKRTDDTFRIRKQPEHHSPGFLNVQTPIEKLDIGMVTQFTQDYMHSVLLGVTRKLLHFWRLGPFQCRLGSKGLQDINNKLSQVAKFVPSDFARTPRNITLSDRFKATECRQFLLYTGPVVLKDTLPKPLYEHFMLLCVAIRILVEINISVDRLQHARTLIFTFVQHFPKIYGADSMSYNVHSLIHLPDDAAAHGSIQSFSAFPFESYLGTLKRCVRANRNALEQIGKRFVEIEAAPKLLVPTNSQGQRVLKLEVKNSVFKLDKRNCYFKGRDTNIYKILNFSLSDTSKIICRRFKKVKDVFKYPACSSSYGIFIGSINYTDDPITLSQSMIDCKVFGIPTGSKGNFALVPMIHF